MRQFGCFEGITVCACDCVSLSSATFVSYTTTVTAQNVQRRGFIVLLAGGGILQKPAASNTGSNSRTRPGILPSIILPNVDEEINLFHSNLFQL